MQGETSVWLFSCIKKTLYKNNLICADYGYCCCKQRAHIRQHLFNDEKTNYWYAYEYQKVKYVDHYTCECGMKKAGEPESQDE